MIDIQVCSYRQDGLMNLAQSMEDSGLASLGATLSVSYDYRTIKTEKFLKFPFIRFIQQEVFPDIAPMFQLRAIIHELPNLGVPWLFFDDDDSFTKETTKYLIECVEFMTNFEKEINRPVFLGTNSWFGSNHHGDMIHISPSNALMAKGKGLLFSPKIWFSGSEFDGYRPLVGGLEDIFMSALAIKHFDAVPLKRFQNPAKAAMRKAADRQESPIHNYKVWSRNIIPAIREISEEPSWNFPIEMGSPGSVTPKVWVKRSKLLQKEYGL